MVGYDNEKMKGHHKHIKEQEIKIEFKNYNQIIEDFEKDIKNIQKELYGGKNGNKN